MFLVSEHAFAGSNLLQYLSLFGLCAAHEPASMCREAEGFSQKQDNSSISHPFRNETVVLMWLGQLSRKRRRTPSIFLRYAIFSQWKVRDSVPTFTGWSACCQLDAGDFHKLIVLCVGRVRHRPYGYALSRRFAASCSVLDQSETICSLLKNSFCFGRSAAAECNLTIYPDRRPSSGRVSSSCCLPLQ